MFLYLTCRLPEIEINTTKSGRKGFNGRERTPGPDHSRYRLPDINGFEVLKNIRLFSSLPVLVLTVREEEADIVKALELGADEYITKPF